ncbi:hypothetical protein AAVH_34028 [Aphelenchoides avenae]|nr:hypothetical protein AAVH_34028 [Aphelenchus avenae]
MSVTIQECTSMDAAARREARRQKILSQAENRLSRILSGPDGDEKRVAPALEGGPLPRISSGGSDESNGPTPSSTAPSSANVSALDADVSMAEIQYKLPEYFTMPQTRFYVAFAVGILLRVAVAAGLLENVMLPWAVGYLSYELLAFRQKKSKYPKHGYIVNFLIVYGWQEDLVVTCGLLVDTLWELAADLLVSTFGFLTVHLPLQLLLEL